MQYVILDLESPCAKNRKNYNRFDCNEIISIGAIKLNEKREVIDEIELLVKPKISKQITKFCTKLTGITNDDLRNANYFDKVIIEFINWVGDDDTIYLHWGPNDETKIKRNVYRYNTGLEWYKKAVFIDLQQDYQRLAKCYKLTSVYDALINLGKVFEGKMHNAKNDAFNTSIIFQELANFDKHLTE